MAEGFADLEDLAERHYNGELIAISLADVSFMFAVPIPRLLDSGIEIVVDRSDGLAYVLYDEIIRWMSHTGRRTVEAGWA